MGEENLVVQSRPEMSDVVSRARMLFNEMLNSYNKVIALWNDITLLDVIQLGDDGNPLVNPDTGELLTALLPEDCDGLNGLVAANIQEFLGAFVTLVGATNAMPTTAAKSMMKFRWRN